MKFQKKMLAIVIMTVLLLAAAAMTTALADEKIYTSPAFSLPKEKIEEWIETLPDDDLPEEKAEEPAEALPGSQTLPVEETVPGEEEQTAVDAPAERKVTIFSSRKDIVTDKEIIELTSVLEGFEGLEYTFQWQVDRNDGAGWVDVEGANGSSHSFVATKETILYSWRLIVDIKD